MDTKDNQDYDVYFFQSLHKEIKRFLGTKAAFMSPKKKIPLKKEALGINVHSSLARVYSHVKKFSPLFMKQIENVSIFKHSKIEMTEFWLNFDWNLTEFWLNFDWILIEIWMNFDWILTAFWLETVRRDRSKSPLKFKNSNFCPLH